MKRNGGKVETIMVVKGPKRSNKHMMTNDLQFGIDHYYRMLNNNKNLD